MQDLYMQWSMFTLLDCYFYLSKRSKYFFHHCFSNFTHVTYRRCDMWRLWNCLKAPLTVRLSDK